MIEICSYMLPYVANSFLKPQLIDLGILDEWATLAMSLV